MRQKLLYVTLAGMLVMPSFLADAAVVGAAENGKVRAKEEVVYATLQANGDLGPVYVVNTLEVAQAGEVIDYGKYRSVKNLTDMSELDQEGESVLVDVEEDGKFYYQGDMEEGTELPWEVTVTYLLDGKKIEPGELAGKSGHVEIKIETAANEKVDAVFYENYLLQVSLMLPNTYQNIEASSGGMQANVGKNKQITFTVMPGKEEVKSVEADVERFEFNGVEIAAVPSSLPIDTSGTEGMTESMSELSVAIGELNDGVAELKGGARKLNEGAVKVRDGSATFKGGLYKLNASSSELVEGSRSIQEALGTINRELSGGATEVDLSSLQELPAVLGELAGGLTETANGVKALKENYAKAYGALDGAIGDIPVGALTEQEIAALYESGADPAVVDKLVANYAAAQKVSGTYAQVREAFAAVEPALTQVDVAVREMSGALTSIADELSTSLDETDLSGLSELTKGLSALAANYDQFHSGLVRYTGGVSELSTSYSQVHSGIAGVTEGTGDLASGVDELSDGTEALHEETKDLPGKLQAEIDSMIQEYDKSDFVPVSFVSKENKKVSSVQFVIKTEGIKVEEKKAKEAEPKKKKGFWTLLKELFS